MLQYVGTQETVHFVNWVLHSGYVDPAVLVRKATEEATAELSKKTWTPEEQADYEECLADATTEKLANILDETLYEVSGQVFPDFGGYEDWPGFGCDVPEGYQFSDRAAILFAPMLAQVLQGEIDFDCAAKHILAHVNQVAKVA